MNIKFLGRGAAFNPKEGNTSAYFIENKELFLIDCGETVFERLIINSILDGIEKINIMITHTHSDHIGSIGSLILYAYYNLKIQVSIIISDNTKYISNIEHILTSVSCKKDMYNYVDVLDYDNKYKSFKTIRYKETVHSETLHCYSLIFETDNGIVFYSGDTKDVTIIKELLTGTIDKMYIDTSTDKSGASHLCIDYLNEIIPSNLKKKVYCMHINNDECLEKIKEYGFNIVEIGDINA